MKSAAAAALLVLALAGCAGHTVRVPRMASLHVAGPSALAHSRCAARNDAIPPNGAFVVCMNGR